MTDFLGVTCNGVCAIGALHATPLIAGVGQSRQGEIDRSDELIGPIFKPLRNLETFRHFRLDPELHTLVWPNGADFAPEFLRARLDRDLRSQLSRSSDTRERTEASRRRKVFATRLGIPKLVASRHKRALRQLCESSGLRKVESLSSNAPELHQRADL